jgi:hypothetical protein
MLCFCIRPTGKCPNESMTTDSDNHALANASARSCWNAGDPRSCEMWSWTLTESDTTVHVQYYTRKQQSVWSNYNQLHCAIWMDLSDQVCNCSLISSEHLYSARQRHWHTAAGKLYIAPWYGRISTAYHCANVELEIISSTSLAVKLRIRSTLGGMPIQ